MHIKELHAFFVDAALLSLLSAAQANRKDEKILMQLMKFPSLYYVLENIIWVVLFTWGIAFSPSNAIYPFIILFPLVASFLPTNRSMENQGFVIPIPFSKAAYDWKAGMRNGGAWGIIISIVLAVVGLFRFEFLLVGIVVSSISIFGFYTQNEPRQILYAVADTSSSFLKKKIRQMALLFLMINSFGLIIGLVFYLQVFYVIAYLFLGSFFVLFLMILQKYITYEPDTNFRANTFIIAFYYISIFIPFLIPLPLVVGIRSWKRANRQLSYYF
ncbi:hypothetical protein [Flammeovirga sp. SJP92]|uniref:hypothetical protein n=1 Tax=Flammeovirga sp. SJP92 TaxID=1775430 RepID=UPI000787EA84|nr:hypothetical protein [Flammeovirga sp. SJP92]KXX71389.1 hypothetical protein AVL50_05665 [Flammeovirga sp. SJP92]